MPEGNRSEQLHMLWPERLLASPPQVEVPRGYVLRTFRGDDAPGYLRLMAAAGFTGWDETMLGRWLLKVIPRGFFVAFDRASGEIVATAMAAHNPSRLHLRGGELGWVAGDPRHAGKGLGTAVCAAAIACFIEAGYRRIYLRTDDHRLAALKTYLKLGYVPFLFAPGMRERWQAVCAKLAWPFEPDTWPTPEDDAWRELGP
jgi:mycothiol synthase